MPTPESKLKKEMHEYIKGCGGYVIPLPAEAYAVKGNPDFIACYRGFFLAVEAKTYEGRVSEWQRLRLSEIRSAGGIAVVCRTLDDVRFVLDRVDELAEKYSMSDSAVDDVEELPEL